MELLSTEVKNNVINSMILQLKENYEILLDANKKDLNAFQKEDQAMYDRLIINKKKIDGMIASLEEVKKQEDPVNKVISSKNLENGLKVVNKTAPFGTIMIIYESRPDVTIEATVLAFKANNKILLKGGEEAIHSNTAIIKLWHKALLENNLDSEFIQLLNLNRLETQEFLMNPTESLDLIVPRGGEKLIQFVKENAKCAVLVSGRGNNFLYIDENTNWKNTLEVIINAKTDKISACNALDKILINKNIPNYHQKLEELHSVLTAYMVTILTDKATKEVLKSTDLITEDAIWYQEFLELKCCIGTVDSVEQAINQINKYSGGHSASIMTTNTVAAKSFMEKVDCAAVYVNASTRFTDGGQMGVGAELAISTDKLHHRGPLGLNELVTNKYYVFGEGHIRK